MGKIFLKNILGTHMVKTRKWNIQSRSDFVCLFSEELGSSFTLKGAVVRVRCGESQSKSQKF